MLIMKKDNNTYLLNPKFEYRNSKQFQNSNYQKFKSKCLWQNSTKHSWKDLLFSILIILYSDLFRISSFGFRILFNRSILTFSIVIYLYVNSPLSPSNSKCVTSLNTASIIPWSLYLIRVTDAFINCHETSRVF